MNRDSYYSGFGGCIRALSALPEFPHPRDFVGKDPQTMRHARSLFGQAPWFDVHAYKDVELIERYVRADMLPGDIPIEVLDTPDWERHCVVPLSALSRGRNADEKRALWAQMMYKRFKRTVGELPIGRDLRLDTWAFRTDAEVACATRLARTDYSVWEGLVGVRQKALMVVTPLLRAEFRYLRKNDYPFWRMNMRWERSARNRLGFLMAHQMIEVDFLKPSARSPRYVPIPAPFQAVEVPLGY